MKICKMGVECVRGAVLQPLSEFYTVKDAKGRVYYQRRCVACTNAATRRQRDNRKSQRAMAVQREERQLMHRKRCAAVEAMGTPTRIRLDLQTQIEQVECRVAIGQSLEFAAWRVGIDPSVVRAWINAA